VCFTCREISKIIFFFGMMYCDSHMQARTMVAATACIRHCGTRRKNTFDRRPHRIHGCIRTRRRTFLCASELCAMAAAAACIRHCGKGRKNTFDRRPHRIHGCIRTRRRTFLGGAAERMFMRIREIQISNTEFTAMKYRRHSPSNSQHVKKVAAPVPVGS
jgi:hypothetical protein